MEALLMRKKSTIIMEIMQQVADMYGVSVFEVYKEIRIAFDAAEGNTSVTEEATKHYNFQ
jgi:hypothetical protein